MRNILLALILLIILPACEELPEPTYIDAIFMMNPDGSNITHIIDEYAENVQFTPDGTRIIMNKGNKGIWSVKIDGSDLTQLITFSVNTELPSIYSEDIKIAFSNGDIYIMDIDGSNLQNITNTPDIEERYPHFSFDGSKIAYTTRQDSINSIYIMESNGENKIEVISKTTTRYFIYRYPIFNASSDTIIYKYFDYPQEGLYSVKVDGTNNNLIIESSIGNAFPSISSDGTKIVFDGGNYIYIISGSGTNIRKLTVGGYPMVSPNGEKIVFSDFKYIKVINNDGTNLIKLDEGWLPSFSNNNKKIVYIKERQIDKNQNKGIVF